MPPKGPARVGAGRPAQNNSYVRNAINELSSPENRSVVVAVSFFAVSNPLPHRCSTVGYEVKEENLRWRCDWKGSGALGRTGDGYIDQRILRLTILLFQAGVAFLSSSWSEALLPP
jgi:hypothetical protein